jgi:hypothetical protein
MHVEIYVDVLVFSDFQCLNDSVSKKKIKNNTLSGEGGIYFVRRIHQHTPGPVLNNNISIHISACFIQ